MIKLDTVVTAIQARINGTLNTLIRQRYKARAMYSHILNTEEEDLQLYTGNNASKI